jgi:anaerobic selenocysteine-containing dehydrogenase
VAWGRQTEINNPENEMSVWFMDALDRARNLILIDPKATRLASRANLWLQLRPGTDAALALGMMNVIIHEGYYENSFQTGLTVQQT